MSQRSEKYARQGAGVSAETPYRLTPTRLQRGPAPFGEPLPYGVDGGYEGQNGVPAEAQRSGFGGERRNTGMGEFSHWGGNEQYEGCSDDLAVYRAAKAEHSRKAMREKARREQQELERRRARAETALRVGICVVLAVFAMAAALIMAAGAEDACAFAEKTDAADLPGVYALQAEPSQNGAPARAQRKRVLWGEEERRNGRAFREKGSERYEGRSDEALVEQGYLSDALPIPYDWQDWLRTYAELYGGEQADEVFLLALAVAETESRFDMTAVGSLGEIGMFQLLPGPGDAYHGEIEAATGLDVHTDAGNIAGGVWKLAGLMKKYGNANDAAMAYNMGEGGAAKARANGVTDTEYSRAVVTAMEKWREVLDQKEEL